MTKICTKCGVEKFVRKFYREKNGRFGVSGDCKMCRSIKHRAWHNANKEQCNAKSRAWRKLNPEKSKASNRAWRKANPEKARTTWKTWYKATSARRRAWRNEWKKQRCETDPKFKLNRNISQAIWVSLKGNKDGQHWEKIVGYALNELREHLEKLFLKNMAWENYGKNGWHIDHKVPVSAFNFTDSKHTDFKRCWALRNLQPMWAKENLEKNNNLTRYFQPSLLI